MNDHVPSTLTAQDTDLLDHANELVDVVMERAAVQYRHFLALPRFVDLLEAHAAFNHGKLFTYAEYCVFREEFLRRFEASSPQACINAFSRLFLKNDISITNLVNALEGTTSEEQALLSRKHDPQE